MTTLLIQDVLTYLTPDEMLLTDDPTAYNSYTVPDDIVVQIKPHRNDDEFYTVNYVQTVNPTDKNHKQKPGPLHAILQLEGLPEDPANFDIDARVKVRIFKRIL